MKYSVIRIIGEGMLLQKNVLVVRYMTPDIGHIHQKQANILNQISVLCETSAQIQNTALRKSSNEFEIELHPEHMEALHSFSSS